MHDDIFGVESKEAWNVARIEQFAGLPAEVHSFIYQRLQDVLTGRDRSADFATVGDDQRAAILAILDETLSDFRGAEGRAF